MLQRFTFIYSQIESHISKSVIFSQTLNVCFNMKIIFVLGYVSGLSFLFPLTYCIIFTLVPYCLILLVLWQFFMSSAQANFSFSSLQQVLNSYCRLMLSNKMQNQLAKSTSYGMAPLLLIGFFVFVFNLIDHLISPLMFQFKKYVLINFSENVDLLLSRFSLQLTVVLTGDLIYQCTYLKCACEN